MTTRASKTASTLQVLARFTEVLNSAEAWEFPVYTAFLIALHNLSNKNGRILVRDVVCAANEVIRVITTPRMYGKGMPAFDKAVEDFLFEQKQYAGFNDLTWLSGGHSQWVGDGKPSDNLPYHSGHRYRRHFYGGGVDASNQKAVAGIANAAPDRGVR